MSEVPQGNQDGLQQEKRLPPMICGACHKEFYGEYAVNAFNIHVRDEHTEVSDMKPSDSDTNTELPLSRPGGGSQDSIDLDKILHRMAQHYQAVALERTPPNKTDFAKAKSDILAWHNTQLKASIPEKWETSSYTNTQGKNYAAGYNQAIDDMQAKFGQTEED